MRESGRCSAAATGPDVKSNSLKKQADWWVTAPLYQTNPTFFSSHVGAEVAYS